MSESLPPAGSGPANTVALPPPAPWVTGFATRAGLLLHHDLTGRTLRLAGAGAARWVAHLAGAAGPAPDAQAAAVDSALLAAGFLAPPGLNPWVLVAPRYLVRARWAVYAEGDAATAPGAAGRVRLSERDARAGGPWQARLLDDLETLVWRLADGTRSVETVLRTAAARFGPEALHDALEVVLGWTHGRAQLLKLLDAPLASLPEPPPHFFGLVHDLPLLDREQMLARGGLGTGPVDLSRYHREAIGGAEQQFEERETTLSHLLRDPTPALGGRTWGEAWVRALESLAALPPGARVLEVGAGTGWLARRALEVRPDLRWHIADLSPALLRDQQRLLQARPTAGEAAEGQARPVPAVQADATALPFAAGSFDVVVANEVIADLETALPAAADRAPTGALGRLGLDLPADRPVNRGALALLAEAARLLRPGGRVWLSEFGTLDEAPREAVHLDHPETGIEFGVLLRAATALGFEAPTLQDAVAALGIEPVPLLAVPPAQFAALNALLVALGGPPLAKRAWTPEAFAAAIAPLPPERLRQVGFALATERVMTFPPRAVQVLTARRGP